MGLDRRRECHDSSAGGRQKKTKKKTRKPQSNVRVPATWAARVDGGGAPQRWASLPARQVALGNLSARTRRAPRLELGGARPADAPAGGNLLTFLYIYFPIQSARGSPPRPRPRGKRWARGRGGGRPLPRKCLPG